MNSPPAVTDVNNHPLIIEDAKRLHSPELERAKLASQTLAYITKLENGANFDARRQEILFKILYRANIRCPCMT